MLLILLACTTPKEEGECPPNTVEVEGACVNADTDTDTDPAAVEDCWNGADDDGDGAVDTADTECRGRLRAVSELVGGSYFSVNQLGVLDGDLRVMGNLRGRLTLDGARVPTTNEDGTYVVGIADGAVEVYPSLLDPTFNVVDAVEWRADGFTSYVDVFFEMTDAAGTTATRDSYHVLDTPLEGDGRLMGRLNLNARAGGIARLPSGDVCVAGYLDDYTVDSAGAVSYSRDSESSFVAWWDAEAGVSWSLGLAPLDNSVQAAKAFPLGDRCVVAMPYGSAHGGPFAASMTHEGEDGMLLVAFAADGTSEVLDEVWGDSYVEVRNGGATEDGGVWMHLKSYGLATSDGAPIGTDAFLEWGADGVAAPLLGADAIGGCMDAWRLGAGDWVAYCRSAGTLTGAGTGSFGLESSELLTLNRVGTAGVGWVHPFLPASYDIGSIAATFTADGDVLVALERGLGDLTLGVGTPEERLLPGSGDVSVGSLVLVTLTP